MISPKSVFAGRLTLLFFVVVLDDQNKSTQTFLRAARQNSAYRANGAHVPYCGADVMKSETHPCL